MTDSIVNDSDLINVQHNLVEASENLRIATCCLRSCYAVAEPRNQDFLRLRTQVTNDAFVYKLKLLPMSQSVIVKFRQFFDYYSTLTYDEFRQRISTIAQGTRVYAEQALFVAETHKEFLIDLKRKEDDCHRVYETLQLEKRNYDAKVREVREAIETRHDWATGLLFFPGIGTIASGVLSVVNMSALDDVVQLQRESELVVAAATMIQDQIIRALDNFVGGMEKVAGFMVLLESEIRTLADRADEAAEEAIKLHYLKLRNRSNDIIDHCNKYIQSVPESMTNLESIPQVYDRYYVQQWLTSKRNESRGILFSDWAITLFKDQPDVINVIVGQY